MCVTLNVGFIFFFFFKLKTAYELRISDWSSDVCSSDLDRGRGALCRHGAFRPRADRSFVAVLRAAGADAQLHGARCDGDRGRHGRAAGDHPGPLLPDDARCVADSRSEEHTSELQSLMRISYAVFCLKKKTPTHNCQNNIKHRHKN